MADLYRKNLESERRQLWATCRLKGLPRDSKERMRIAEIDTLLAEHKAKQPERAKAPSAAKRKAKPKRRKAAKKPEGQADASTTSAGDEPAG